MSNDGMTKEEKELHDRFMSSADKASYTKSGLTVKIWCVESEDRYGDYAMAVYRGKRRLSEEVMEWGGDLESLCKEAIAELDWWVEKK